ncbi:hypothetical protein SK128_019404, partial [Halocaridina rubra]
MASRFAALGDEVDLDERFGKRKTEKPKPKNEDITRKTIQKTNNIKKKKAVLPLDNGPS